MQKIIAQYTYSDSQTASQTDRRTDGQKDRWTWKTLLKLDVKTQLNAAKQRSTERQRGGTSPSEQRDVIVLQALSVIHVMTVGYME